MDTVAAALGDAAELVGTAQPADLGLGGGGHPPWVAVGDAGPIVQASEAVLAVAGPPAVGGRAGDAHLGGDVGGGTASGDALAQDKPSCRGEPGVSVGHWDLRAGWVPSDSSTYTRRSLLLSTTLVLSTASGYAVRAA